MKCVETVSLGKVDRSTTRTRCPRLASSIASGDPAHRAPTMITSYKSFSRRFLAFCHRVAASPDTIL
jgi:hypothetical protein